MTPLSLDYYYELLFIRLFLFIYLFYLFYLFYFIFFLTIKLL